MTATAAHPARPGSKLGHWVEDALCAQVDPDLFFPGAGIGARVALRLCSSCPVTHPCLLYAVANRIDTGIYGGLPPRRRKQLTPDDVDAMFTR